MSVIPQSSVPPFLRTGLWRKILFAICMTLALNIAIFAALWTTQMGQMGTLLPTGRPVPLFALPDQDGRIHHLSDYAGRPLVLVFFPEMTPTISQELCALRDSMPAFDRSGAKVFAISTLASAQGKTFHDSNNLNFPILHDAGARTAQIYGAVDAAHHIRTASFAVDNTGILMLTLPDSQIDAPQHGQQLLRMASCCFDPVVNGISPSIGHTIADCALPRTDNGQEEHLVAPHSSASSNTTGSNSSTSSTRSRATVIFFVSSRCPCSRGYDVRMKALAEAYTQRGVRFLGVNASADETVADAEAHRAQANLPFPMLKDHDLLLTDRLQAHVTPEAFVLDAKGVVRYSGRIDNSRDATNVTRHDVQEALDALLAGKLPTTTHGSAPGCAIVRR